VKIDFGPVDSAITQLPTDQRLLNYKRVADPNATPYTDLRELVEGDGKPSLRHQCELLGLARSSFYYQPCPETPENLQLMRRLDQLHLEFPVYPSVEEAPIEAETLLKARRQEDEGVDLWRTTNRLQDNLVNGGVSDFHQDRRGRLRSVRALRGIDAKVSLNKGLWGLVECLANGQSLDQTPPVILTA
jgi:hypothetical protein